MKKLFFLSVLFVCVLCSCSNPVENGRGDRPDFGGPGGENPGGGPGGQNQGGGTAGGNLVENTDSGKTTLTSEYLSFNDISIENIYDWIYEWNNSYVPNVSSRNIISNTQDEISNVDFQNTIYLNLSDMSFSQDNVTYQKASSVLTEVKSGISILINDSVVEIDSSELKENLSICVSGTTEDGAIKIKSAKKYSLQLILNNVSITSSRYPCINVDSKSQVFITSTGKNVLNDNREFGTGYSEEEGVDYYTSSWTGSAGDSSLEDLELTQKWVKGDDSKGSIYTKGILLLNGSGSITLNTNYKHGIYSKDYIRVFEGEYSITSTGRNGIQTVNGFIMDGGSVTIKGDGSHTNNESRGIIVEGSEENPGEGFICIKNGNIDIDTYSKAISAKWDIDEDFEDDNTNDISNDPYPFVLISGGNLNIKTRGTPQDESAQEATFIDANGVSVSEKTSLSPEGIEGKQAVFITGGIITLDCSDDAINASREDKNYGGVVKIAGGNIYIYSKGNDGIDSNGNLYISGGIVISLAPVTPECAFDCDQNIFSITGGLLLGIGTSNYSKPSSSDTEQGVFVLSGDSYGSGNLCIQNEDGENIFVYSVPSAFNSNNFVMIASSPMIETGKYNVIKNADVQGGETFHGLYVEMPSVSNGTTVLENVEITENQYVYSKTSSSGGFGNNPF